MSTFRGTPGPWVSHDITDPDDIACGAWVVDLPDDPDATVHQIYFGDMESNTGRDIANANLVAAAPDLLAACMAALEPAGDTPDEVRQQLRDAIDLALLSYIRQAAPEGSQGR